MRLIVPAGVLVWGLAGALLVVLSLVAISPASEFRTHSTFVILSFAVWTAIGVDGLGSMERVWRGPWRRVAVTASAALPLLLSIAATSQLLSEPRLLFLPPPSQIVVLETAAIQPLTLAVNHQPDVRRAPAWFIEPTYSQPLVFGERRAYPRIESRSRRGGRWRKR